MADPYKKSKKQTMKAEKIRRLERLLDKLFDHLKSIREETIIHLGEDAFHIIDFHASNWIEINGWISAKYGEELKILRFQFFRLFKETYWLQLLFQKGNYPIVYRNLRYILELICQAYYVESKYSNLSLDEQIEKTKEMEKNKETEKKKEMGKKKIFGWNLVQSVLCKIFTNEDVQTKIRKLWNYLNIHAHPSGTQMDIVAIEDISSLVTDSFDEKLAREVLKVTDEIFDIINTIVMKKFPKIKELGLEYKFLNEWEKYLPNTMKIMRE